MLTISEIQARWFIHLIKKDVKLPSETEMNEQIQTDLVFLQPYNQFWKNIQITQIKKKKSMARFHHSSRHTIQQDPIVYNDQVSEFFGAKPDMMKNLLISWRLCD